MSSTMTLTPTALRQRPALCLGAPLVVLAKVELTSPGLQL